MMKIEEKRIEIEDFIKNKSVIDYFLKSNPNLYYDKIKTLIASGDTYYFEHNESFIKLIGEPIIIEITNNYNYDFLYISDFEYNGNCYFDLNEKIEIYINGTIRLFTTKFNQIDLQPNQIQLMPSLVNIKDKYAFEIWSIEEKDEKILELKETFNFLI